MGDFSFAADMGGTRIKLGLVSQGRILARKVLPSESHRPVEWQMKRIKDEWLALCRERGLVIHGSRGAGIAFPAIIDRHENKPTDYYGKFPGSTDFDFSRWADEELSCSIVLENDARCALLGESRYGAGKDTANLALFTLGTGIGSAIMENSKLTGGERGNSGNLLGHRPSGGEGIPCVCGRKDCAEARTSLKILNERIRSRSDYGTSRLSRYETVDYRILFDCRREGDAPAREISNSVMEIWADAMIPALEEFQAERVIIGGGIMASGDIILPYVQERLKKVNPSIVCRAALCGDDAGLLGAAELLTIGDCNG
ncbi:ROK family protein [Spirochaeta isovalerica]|uniref:Glucokinase n=1 Tax=Spirochaeta isovalerica TaxID=150 RepID=A0A841R7Y6_9SPIO|nr:ROK family protein [Spirochaeta isovalerica]MBB6479936.1 glucokinase [Spirochaeta isovalerica]